MSSLLEYFAKLGHTLSLKEKDVIGVDAACEVCGKTVIGSPMYTCNTNHIDCQNFYLHKSCAQLTTQLNYHQHNKHSLVFEPNLKYCCDGCYLEAKLFSYRCDNCDFDVCVVCVLEQRELGHIGHEEHTLTLMKRKSLFRCDACGDEAKDSSYICLPCEFWIHEKCAVSPEIIPDPAYHHHPLHLVYSIPDMHRYFDRTCAICDKLVSVNRWLYYCHKCTFFVHMNCASSLASLEYETGVEGLDYEPGLIKFPLPSEESLFDLIIFRPYSDSPDDPEKINHPTHMNHPLGLLPVCSEEDTDDDNDDRRVLICDGCIQPITVSHRPYYGCLQCGYFLHSYCANYIPQKLLAGASPIHPEHVLHLTKPIRFYSLVKCGICMFETNGFYYQCESCDMKIDIRCASMPAKIKHTSHKHSLVQSLLKEDSVCEVSKYSITNRMAYACETCKSYQIHIASAFYPSEMKQRYDPHPITLMFPPFHYEGVFYCEICEEQVNNQWWLYHCKETDLSFHFDCLRWFHNIKLGGTIVVEIDNKKHTLTMVLKRLFRKNSPLYTCSKCGTKYKLEYFLECCGCGYLQCQKCSLQILGEG